MPDRTPEERERDRLEREAKRAAREGRPPPSAEPPSSAAGAFGAPAPAASDAFAAPPAQPAETPGQPRRTDDLREPPPATGRQWRRAAGDPDPDPPLVRRVPPGTPRESLHAHDEPLPQPAGVEPPERRIPRAPGLDGEQAIGTRRVSAGHRIGRPHMPHLKRSPRGPGEPSGRRIVRGRIGALLALVAVAALLWFAASLFQPFAGDGTGTVVVTIPKGASVGQVGDVLAAKHVIGSSFFFGLRARLEGKDSHLNSGRQVLKRDMSYAAVLDALTRTKAAPVVALGRLSIPEGLSRTEIAPRAKAAGLAGDYVAAGRASKALDPRKFGAPRGATLEGFLFPATYRFRPGSSVRGLIAQQLTAFRQNIANVDLKRAKRKNLTTYDVLVIASMVEREAQIAKDRPLIAAVIYNRLHQGMPLGIDATLRYALHNWTTPLKVSELNSNSAYNTRKHTGLPPTPIGNPGLASIQAAAHPAKVSYLFYVVKPCGNGAHNFSSTDAQFQKDVDAYNAKRTALGGKSPVTCK
jgi:UPF0755 protein